MQTIEQLLTEGDQQKDVVKFIERPSSEPREALEDVRCKQLTVLRMLG